MRWSQEKSDEKKEKVEAAMKAVVDAIVSGKAIDMCAKTALTGYPCHRWSFGNQLLMLIAGTDDARGFRQWKEIGRWVKAGAKAFHILAPNRRKVGETEDPSTGEKKAKFAIKGFLTVPVFRYEDTEGKDREPLAPKSPPPLIEVAARFGIQVNYAPLNGAYGSYSPAANTITLATHHESTFFHELAHAAHKEVRGKLKLGQDVEQEVVAEMAAAILERIYLPESKHMLGRHVAYIRHYAEVKPGEAATKAMALLGEVQKVLGLILDLGDEAEEVEAAEAEKVSAA